MAAGGLALRRIARINQNMILIPQSQANVFTCERKAFPNGEYFLPRRGTIDGKAGDRNGESSRGWKLYFDKVSEEFENVEEIEEGARRIDFSDDIWVVGLSRSSVKDQREPECENVSRASYQRQRPHSDLIAKPMGEGQ